MNKILLMFFGIFLISVVSAGPIIKIEINGNSLNASGFIYYEGLGTYPAPIITPIQDIIGSCSTNNITNQTSCTYNYTKDISILSFSNSSVTVMTDATSQAYLKCLDDKALYTAGQNTCNTALKEQQEYKENYTSCYIASKTCETDLSYARAEAKKSKEDLEKDSNQKFVWGIVGMILGILGALAYYKSGIFSPKVKGPEDNFNRQQSG
ncbi:MAG: hypothetical protein AABY22_02430 [Nanoarchaeota archaeon]